MAERSRDSEGLNEGPTNKVKYPNGYSRKCVTTVATVITLLYQEPRSRSYGKYTERPCHSRKGHTYKWFVYSHIRRLLPPGKRSRPVRATVGSPLLAEAPITAQGLADSVLTLS
ncbi:hypothetical protein J6590_003312 [Homalodisca vitripennis]|nr:hypothetical protein J6590_003312 [Homalodisca vitripennis]